MKKISVLFILLFACKCFSALPFLLGFEGGYVANRLNTSTGYRIWTEYERGSGFLVGVPIFIPITSNEDRINYPSRALNRYISLGTGMRYIQKNYTFRRPIPKEYFVAIYGFPINVPIYFDQTNGFLQFPLYVDFALGQDSWRAYFEMGATFDYWLHSNRSGTLLGMFNVYSFDESVEFCSIRDRRFQVSLFAGLGFRYVLSGITSFIGVQYHRGLSDLQKNYMERGQVARYNNAVAVNTGFLFGRMK